MSERPQKLRNAIEGVLSEVDGVIALKAGPAGRISPHVFHKDRPQELDLLAIWPKEPLPSILRLVQKKYPHASLAVVCRGCEERGIVEMVKHAQIKLDNVKLIGLHCVQAEASFCRCPKPYPLHAEIVVGERIEGVSNPQGEDLLSQSKEERLAFWKKQFLHCIKCYGCRNVCPQCFCEACALEDQKWVQTGYLPMPMPPMYHMIRAVHTAGKCVGCHECEETCPAGIPLTILYRWIAQDVKVMFGYEAGASLDEQPPQLLDLQEGELNRSGLPH
ncbi:MAG: hypothetical protein GTO14_06480 [Anaerolineales bacterium]|nr:hypothetical protein [Anaerolineales bacterium]